MASEKLAEILFENSELIPEGLYLQLINLSRDCFKEREAKTKIKYVGDDFKYFEEYNPNPFEIEDQYAYIYVGDIFEEQSPYRNKRIFYQIVKKNSKSYRLNKIEFELTERDENQYYITRKHLENAEYYNWDNLRKIMIPRNAFCDTRRQIYRKLMSSSSNTPLIHEFINEDTAQNLFPAFDF